MPANPLKLTAIAAETAIVASTAAISFALIHAVDLLTAAPIAVTVALEACRMPLVLRMPKLRFLSSVAALALAGLISAMTGEILALGFENVLNARALPALAAEERLAEARASLRAAGSGADRRLAEIERLTSAVAAAQAHSEAIGREAVALQNNPSVSAYRGRKGWRFAGSQAANAAAAANAHAQAEHANREQDAEAELASARFALAEVKPIDIEPETRAVAEALKTVERERAASPVHRLAAAIYATDVASLTEAQYSAVKRAIVLGLAAAGAFGTLLAGLIASLPERGEGKPSKLSLALRRMIAARRKTLRRIEETVRVETRYRDRIVYVPVSTDTGQPKRPPFQAAAE